MRVLVSTTAGSGHFGPLVPFARACVEAGHEVRVAAPESFGADVAAAGLQLEPFADPAPELLRPVWERMPGLGFAESNRVVVTEIFGRLDAQAAWPGLTETVLRWRPDLVLREPAEFGSLVAARAAGVPQAMVAIGVSAMLDDFWPLVLAPLAELDALAGLPEGTCASTMQAASTLTCVPEVLDGAPRPRPVGAGAVHRFRDDVLATGRGALPDAWGESSHPLVYVTFGSVAAAVGGSDLYRAALGALADEPVRVLMTTGEGIDLAELGPVPANAHVERWWPQADVLPHAAAVVGHGGFGTTMGALAAGVPQVVMPLFSSDQHLNAEHVAAVGAGVHLDGGPAAVAALPGAVSRLLSDGGYRDSARAVAEAMGALPPVADAVALLERVAAS